MQLDQRHLHSWHLGVEQYRVIVQQFVGRCLGQQCRDDADGARGLAGAWGTLHFVDWFKSPLSKRQEHNHNALHKKI
jgi:hypothetical protein